MSAINTRTSIVQFFGSLALGILIGGLIGYIGNTELVHLIRPMAIVFFAGIGVLVAVFLYFDAWRRRALRNTLHGFTNFFSENREDLTEAVRLLQAKQVMESIDRLPRPSRHHLEGITRLAQAYAGIVTASTLINVSVAAAAALLAAAMIAEQNKLIKNQNVLIDLQHELQRNKARASAIEYVDRRYYLFAQNERSYPSGHQRRSRHFDEFATDEQAALQKYWALVYAQWYTLGGNVDQESQTKDRLPSYEVWTDYLLPIVRETGRAQALAEALCYSIQQRHWPATQARFVRRLLLSLEPSAVTTFLPCCTNAPAGVDGVRQCARSLSDSGEATASETPDAAHPEPPIKQ